ncbi:MAG: RNA 2',3'-cyclic phosphodiesterase [Nitrospirae bacterium]|nr:RNA 2',3'-cyclic phosphodiesterase [Nitrospirota bacterium]
METVRTFVAIEVPPPIKEALARVQQTLRQSGAEVRWVRMEGIHLTLKFLGEVAPTQIPALREGLASVCGRVPPFPVQIGGPGFFPNSGKGSRPRVIWIGVEDPRGMLSTLQEGIEETCTRLGFPPEGRPYQPHLTLGRVQGSRRLEALREAVAGLQGQAVGAFDAREVVLMQSDLRPSGAVYTPLATLPLGVKD